MDAELSTKHQALSAANQALRAQYEHDAPQILPLSYANPLKIAIPGGFYSPEDLRHFLSLMASVDHAL